MYVQNRNSLRDVESKLNAYQMGEGSGEGQIRGRGLRNTNYYI